MKNKINLYVDSDIRNEAFSWIAQLETSELSTEDLAAFQEWISRSPKHYVEIREAAELSRQVNVLADLAGHLNSSQKKQSSFMRSKRVGVRGRGGAFVAVSICACALIWFSINQFNKPHEVYQIATVVGQVEEAALTDGSSVKLNTNSEIEVDFEGNERRVLLNKGEVFFDVAHNPDKPFSVYVEGRRITAVGTAFAVRRTNNELIVTVSEGKVLLGVGELYSSTKAQGKTPSVSGLSIGGPNDKLITAGQQLHISNVVSTPVVEEITLKDMSRQLAWRAGILEFDKKPLIDVVAEMQRYTPKNIKLEDEQLGELTFGGVFRAGETEAFFEALEYSFNLKVVNSDDGSIVISRKE
ncbi:FecR family protein [Hirschia litorea]|uniref:FecR family protein n=1 Tax=Hirschia litorea TaxID=1199156 RepID=A0ABW2INW7_9PROT